MQKSNRVLALALAMYRAVFPDLLLDSGKKGGIVRHLRFFWGGKFAGIEDRKTKWYEGHSRSTERWYFKCVWQRSI